MRKGRWPTRPSVSYNRNLPDPALNRMYSILDRSSEVPLPLRLDIPPHNHTTTENTTPRCCAWRVVLVSGRSPKFRRTARISTKSVSTGNNLGALRALTAPFGWIRSTALDHLSIQFPRPQARPTPDLAKNALLSPSHSVLCHACPVAPRRNGCHWLT